MSLYQIRLANPLARSEHQYWEVKKFDEDFNCQATYQIVKGKCNCPAGTGRPYVKCRHRRMVKSIGRALEANPNEFFDAENWAIVERKGIDA